MTTTANKKTLLITGIALAVLAIGAAGVVYSGIYNVAADDPHTRPVYALLEAARKQSISARATKLEVPADLNDPERIRQGAGNYNAMCTGCHLSPGAAETELSKGLYPSPPNLTKETIDAAEAFWVIKHGVKASGMPAWGKSMGDDYIWNMAAFLQELPKLDKTQYDALVGSSGGHSHGGGETGGHAHADGGKDHHDEAEADHHGEGEAHPEGAHAEGHGMTAQESAGKADAPAAPTHVHADGKSHTHSPQAPTTPTASDPSKNPHDGMSMQGTESSQSADDGHDHKH